MFVKDVGTVTAGNASGICDGAAANVIMSESALKKFGVQPLVRIAAYSWSACEPEIMGIGPVVSIKEALKKAGKTISDMDLIDVNEVCNVSHPGRLSETDLRVGVRGTMACCAERARVAIGEDEHVRRSDRPRPPPGRKRS